MSRQAAVVAFHCEWYDSNAAMVRLFRVNHFADGTLEVINLKTRQTFLKRMFFENIQRADFFLGATVTINCRQMVVVDYADEGTKLHCAAHGMRLFGLVKPEALGALAAVLAAAQQTFTVTRLKMVDLDAGGGRRFNCAPGPAAALEASLLGAGPDVAQRWADFVASQGRAMAGAHSAGDASSDDALFCFEVAPASAGDLPRGAATACLVKPHVVAAGRLGELVGAVQARGFKVEALQMLTLGQAAATAFLDVYKGVLPHYAQTVAHVTEGPSVFLKLSGPGPNVVTDFRDACGPGEVELAKLLRPQSLRALFGADSVRNAVHCTDLPEDGALEVGYFMHLLSL